MTHPDILRCERTGENNRSGPAPVLSGEVEVTLTIPLQVMWGAECTTEEQLRMHAVDRVNTMLRRLRKRWAICEDCEVVDSKILGGLISEP